MQLFSFVFLEEIEDSKKAFQNCLTFICQQIWPIPPPLPKNADVLDGWFHILHTRLAKILPMACRLKCENWIKFFMKILFFQENAVNYQYNLKNEFL